MSLLLGRLRDSWRWRDADPSPHPTMRERERLFDPIVTPHETLEKLGTRHNVLDAPSSAAAFLRQAFYMLALVGCRLNPDIKAAYSPLVKAGMTQ